MEAPPYVWAILAFDAFAVIVFIADFIWRRKEKRSGNVYTTLHEL